MGNNQSQQQTSESADVQHAENNQSERADAKSPTGSESLQTTPSVRPTVVQMAIAFLGIIAVVAAISLNQHALGGQDNAEIATQVVGVIGLLIILRLAIQIFVLTRTVYEINENRIQRRYSLFLRTSSREVPIEMVRSNELEQKRVQKVMGYGTVRVNQGLGDIRLENVRNPHLVQSMISSQRFESDGA